MRRKIKEHIGQIGFRRAQTKHQTSLICSKQQQQQQHSTTTQQKQKQKQKKNNNKSNQTARTGLAWVYPWIVLFFGTARLQMHTHIHTHTAPTGSSCISVKAGEVLVLVQRTNEVWHKVNRCRLLLSFFFFFLLLLLLLLSSSSFFFVFFFFLSLRLLRHRLLFVVFFFSSSILRSNLSLSLSLSRFSVASGLFWWFCCP
jgi:hypothetical protein